MPHRNVLPCILCITCYFSATIARADTTTTVTLTSEPTTPLIEHRDGRQLLNFDLVATNHGSHTLRLSELEVSVFDTTGKLALRKAVNSNGLSPGIDAIGQATLRPGDTTDIFNPFYSLADEVPIGRMEYTLRYQLEDNEQQREHNQHRLPMDYDVEAHTNIDPSTYRTKTDLILPLAGRVFIWDGHEFYSHHRRVPLDSQKVRGAGIRANANRYAADLVIIDPQGRLCHDDPHDKKNWYTYGAAVRAPGSGKVIAAANNIPDNEFNGMGIKYPALPAGADENLGNYVLIDHGNGEYSILPHMLAGTVIVKAGDLVRQGDQIGRVGFSGDGLFPHVHYNLLSGKEVYQSEGVPAYFTKFKRLLGAKTLDIKSGTLDSGDIVQSTAR